ncbi:MAG: 2,3-dihydro-2,3-dihydroxybenzoate dehydrogenase [Pseudomonadota bacterium]|nr:2,3-dihydro-2,3-dihydroxybenzoate dehydrogenase [Pseudomonadota bacterium]
MPVSQPSFPSSLPFPGKVAVVTGAAQGIGAAVTHALAAQGIMVAALDIRAEAVTGAGDGAQVRARALDVTDAAAVRDVVESVERELGPIGMLVNAAGVLRMGSVLEQEANDWARCFAVNTHGVHHLSREVARHMRPRGQGSIVTVGSNAALVPRMRMAAYAASKAATHQFVKCLGLELAGSGIRCNIVAPGSTDTPMLRGMWCDRGAEQDVVDGSLTSYRCGIPLGRIATAQDVANAVLFLLSDVSRHVTLHTLCVDGGATLGQ